MLSLLSGVDTCVVSGLGALCQSMLLPPNEPAKRGQRARFTREGIVLGKTVARIG